MSKVMGIYVKFTMTTHQIWSCHVTLASNSEIFIFLPNSIVNFRKSTKFGGNWLKSEKATGKKQIGGVKMLIGLMVDYANLQKKGFLVNLYGQR